MYFTQKKHVFCPSKCCRFTMAPSVLTWDTIQYAHSKIRKRKAGVFMYDPTLKKVLLVQSRGDKWGFPKGTMEDGETIEECAIREVLEETGIRLTLAQIHTYLKFRIDKATYYYAIVNSTLNMYQTEPETSIHNDATGIVWISLDCLVACVQQGQMLLNSHCKKLLGKILKINF